MNGLRRRLERASEKLSAKERALLVLRALKKEEPVDPTWRRSMPEQQAEEFDRYVSGLRGFNVGLAWNLWTLRQEAEELSVQMELIGTLLHSGASAWRTRLFMMHHAKEPVTESEYRELEALARADFVPAEDLAELLAEAGEREESPGPANAERLRAEKRRELLALVANGALPGREEDGRMLVQAGPFFDRLGEPLPMHPAWALEYEVFPDERAEEVEHRREERLAIQELAEAAPMWQTARFRGLEEELVALAEPSPQDDLLEGHAASFRAGMAECWRWLLAVERTVEELRADLDGEDPLVPGLREQLDESRSLLEMCADAERWLGQLKLDEPDERNHAMVRAWMDLVD